MQVRNKLLEKQVHDLRFKVKNLLNGIKVSVENAAEVGFYKLWSQRK